MEIRLHKNGFFGALCVLADVIAVFGANPAAFYIAPRAAAPGFNWPAAACEAVCALLCFYIFDLYKKNAHSPKAILIFAAIAAVICACKAAALSLILGPRFEFSAVRLGLSAAMLFAALALLRSAVNIGLKKFLRGKSLLIIGPPGRADGTAKKIAAGHIGKKAVCLALDAGDESEIGRIIKNELPKYSGVFILPGLAEPQRDRLFAAATSRGSDIFILPDLYNISLGRYDVVNFDDTPALRVSPFGLTGVQRAAKRCFDIFFSLIGVVITSPLMLAAVIAVRLSSRGPIIYRQERLTYGEKRFDIYKFRSMIDNAEKYTGAVLAAENDPRITRAGAVLRRFRIDELPQFFNVLAGHMSLVGPRPERGVFVEKYKTEIADYDKRFMVPAGLTGLQQVYSRYETVAADRLLYDMMYIKNYSLFMDVKIILLTVKTVLVKNSAAVSGSAAPEIGTVKAAEIKPKPAAAREKTNV